MYYSHMPQCRGGQFENYKQVTVKGLSGVVCMWKVFFRMKLCRRLRGTWFVTGPVTWGLGVYRDRRQ